MYNIGDDVQFVFAGSWRVGKIIELSKQPDGNATYTAKASNGRIYPCLGINGSTETGWISSGK